MPRLGGWYPNTESEWLYFVVIPNAGPMLCDIFGSCLASTVGIRAPGMCGLWVLSARVTCKIHMSGDRHPIMCHPWTRVQMSCHILDMAASLTILFRCFSASGLRNLREIRKDHTLRDNLRSLPFWYPDTGYVRPLDPTAFQAAIYRILPFWYSITDMRPLGR